MSSSFCCGITKIKSLFKPALSSTSRRLKVRSPLCGPNLGLQLGRWIVCKYRGVYQGGTQDRWFVRENPEMTWMFLGVPLRQPPYACVNSFVTLGLVWFTLKSCLILRLSWLPIGYRFHDANLGSESSHGGFLKSSHALHKNQPAITHDLGDPRKASMSGKKEDGLDICLFDVPGTKLPSDWQLPSAGFLKWWFYQNHWFEDSTGLILDD